MTGDLVGIWKELVIKRSSYCPVTCLDRLKKARKCQPEIIRSGLVLPPCTWLTPTRLRGVIPQIKRSSSAKTPNLFLQTESRGFDSRRGHWIFLSDWPNPSGRTRPWGSLSDQKISIGVKRGRLSLTILPPSVSRLSRPKVPNLFWPTAPFSKKKSWNQ
jgi:hypothetical protein